MQQLLQHIAATHWQVTTQRQKDTENTPTHRQI